MSAHVSTRRPWRTAVVESHTMQRLRAAELLSSAPGLASARPFASMPELLSWLRASARTEWPHLLVVDPDDQPAAMIDAIGALSRAGMRVVVLSDMSPARIARRLAARPADAVVSKRDPEERLLDAVAALRSGEPWSDDAPASEGPAAPRLSVQEERVLELYATGMPITLVAQQIGVRPDTARKYLSRVKEKYARFGRPARSKIDLARVAWEDGYGEQRRPALSGAPTSSR